MPNFNASPTRVVIVCRAFVLVLTISVLCARVLGDGSAACTQTDGPTQALGLFKPGVAVPLDEGFQNPPAISRVQCWWQCHGSAFTKKEITRQLEQLKTQGMGGVTVKDTVLQPRDAKTAHIKDIAFMSPQWLDMFSHIVSECTRLGLICRCRLGSGWNAGGPWITPEMSTQLLGTVSSEPIVGPRRFTGAIPTTEAGQPTSKSLQRGNAFIVAVGPSGVPGIDLTDRVSPDGMLTWDVPEGTWTLVACVSEPSGRMVGSCSPSGAGRHHDHLSTAGTDLQLRMVAEPISRALGPFADTAFDGFNCDSWELGNPEWTPGLRGLFRDRLGYDAVPYLPTFDQLTQDLIGRKLSLTSELSHTQSRFLYDFRTVVSDLIIETHYRRISHWCREHGVAFEAQAGGPSVVPRDMLMAQGACDIPMGEFWMNGLSYVKIASSGAHLYGRRLVGLESFTDTRSRMHFAISPAAMKPRLDEAYLLGGNYLTMAVTEYSPAEAGLPGWVHNAGPHLNHCQTFWPMIRPFYDYMARCCFLLQTGRNVAHVAEYRNLRTSKTSLWREGNDKLSSWPKTFSFDYINDDAIQNHMIVRNGQIAVDCGATYQVLYVASSPDLKMPLATLKKLSELVRHGATVVWSGKRPTACPSLVGIPQSDAEWHTALDSLLGEQRLITLRQDDRFALIPLVEKCSNPPAWKMQDRQPLRFVHRQAPGIDIFFVVNRASRAVKEPITFRILDRKPEFWNAESGKIRPAPHHKADDGVEIDLRMDPLASLFVVFRKDAPALPRPLHVSNTPVELKPIVIPGPWKVTFSEGSGAPKEAIFENLQSFPDRDEPGIRHFSGVATYRTEFTCPKSFAAEGVSARLDLGHVHELAEVWLNGKLQGITWHPPYRFDVAGSLRPGTNQLEVRVANLWHNRIVGDAPLPPQQRITRMVPEKHYNNVKGTPLLDSGLTGPVRIETGQQ